MGNHTRTIVDGANDIDRALVLSLLVKEEYVDIAANFLGVSPNQLKRNGGVFATGNRHHNSLEIRKEPTDPLLGSLQHIFLQV